MRQITAEYGVIFASWSDRSDDRTVPVRRNQKTTPMAYTSILGSGSIPAMRSGAANPSKKGRLRCRDTAEPKSIRRGSPVIRSIMIFTGDTSMWTRGGTRLCRKTNASRIDTAILAACRCGNGPFLPTWSSSVIPLMYSITM